MLFVSSSSELSVTIRGSLRQSVVNTLGQAEGVIVRPMLYANFKPRALDFGQRQRADIAFKQINPKNPYGATPYLQNGIMGSQFSDEVMESAPEPFLDYDPIHQLGKFDTATDIDYAGQLGEDTPTEADVRRFVEQKMLADTSFNSPTGGFILLDGVVVALPWPNYPVEGAGRHKTIEMVVKQTGIDPRLVIAFESSQDKPGEGVISAMEALVGEFDADKAEENALSVEIPA